MPAQSGIPYAVSPRWGRYFVDFYA
jgi:hypothetical protein